MTLYKTHNQRRIQGFSVDGISGSAMVKIIKKQQAHGTICEEREKFCHIDLGIKSILNTREELSFFYHFLYLSRGTARLRSAGIRN